MQFKAGALELVRKDGLKLVGLKRRFREDPEMRLAAVQQNLAVWEQLKDELGDDSAVVRVVVAQDGWALEDASERLRDSTLQYSKSQTLDDRRLADARRPREHGIVLLPPRQHLDESSYFGVPSYNGVQLAMLRPLDQLDGVQRQGVEGLGRIFHSSCFGRSLRRFSYRLYRCTSLGNALF